jgi:DNA repair exonuclease SbcCD ATPase subunit
MEIRLNAIALNNFKGVKDLALEFDGGNAVIYGTNATGKTTVYDAFLWLLFGKDSLGRTDFDIKALDAEGNPVSGLDHSVEAVLSLDGKPIALKKTYKEKWTKRRGSAKSEFSGHTTDYHIDGVPVTKTAFAAKIDAIVDEETFKLLTSARYFNEGLAWQKRREILLNVCGDVSDKDVIAANKDLAKLAGILGERSLDDHRKVIAEARKKINGELMQIPVRLDELDKSMPDITGIDREAVRKEIHDRKQAKAALEKEKGVVENGGQTAGLYRKLDEVNAEIQKNNTAADKEREERLAPAMEESARLQKSIEEADEALRRLFRERDADAEKLPLLEKEIKAQRNLWHEVNNARHEGETVCPTCGQDLPCEAVKAAVEKHNAWKAEKLKEIQARGKALAKEVEDIKTRNIGLCEEIEANERKIGELLKLKQACNTEAEKIRGLQPDNAELLRKKADLEARIESAGAGENKQAVQDLEAGIAREETRIEEAGALLAKLDQAEAGRKRRNELLASEKRLAKEFEDLEHELYLCDQFIRTKVDLLESRINSRFLFTRFKLFEEQINGGVTETCVAMFGGVPYPSLNNAARINVGLDILNTLSGHYGVAAPVFVDNAEAVVDLAHIDAQTIKLVVSADHDKLTMTKEDEACQNRKAS